MTLLLIETPFKINCGVHLMLVDPKFRGTSMQAKPQ